MSFTMEDLFGPASDPTASPTPASTPVVSPQTKFDIAYHQSRPIPVQWLRETADQGIRDALALKLYTRYPIDPQLDIDMDGYDAYLTMEARSSAGIPSIPSFHQGLPNDPVVSIPTIVDPAQFVKVPRSFGVHDFQAAIAWLNAHGIGTGNVEYTGIIPTGLVASQITDPSQLRPFTQNSPIFAGALAHYGIVITGVRKNGALIVDAEFTAAVIQAGDYAGVTQWLTSLG